MTAKQTAHQLLDQLPEHISWEDLLASLREAAGRVESPGGGLQEAEASGQRGTPNRDPIPRERRLADELDEIALHCARLPVRDPRSADEILGYDEHGLPR